MKEVRMGLVSYWLPIWRCEEHLDSWPLFWSHRAPSLPRCLSLLTEGAWAAQAAMGSFLAFPSSYLIPVHLLSPLLWLNLPPIPDQPCLEGPQPLELSKSCVLSSQPFPDSISDAHHLQIQPCLPRASQTRQAQPPQEMGSQMSFTLLGLAFAAVLYLYPLNR